MDILDAPKSFKGRRVLPMGSLKPMFARAIAGKGPDDFVFQPAGGYRYIWEHLVEAAEAVSCRTGRFGWHSLRRAHNTWMSKGGASAADRMAQMGHSTSATNDIYLIAESEDFARRERLVLALQERLMGTVGGKAN